MKKTKARYQLVKKSITPSSSNSQSDKNSNDPQSTQGTSNTISNCNNHHIISNTASNQAINQVNTNSLRAGDWVCLICSNLNFSFRNECNRCFLQTKKQNYLQNMMLKEQGSSLSNFSTAAAANQQDKVIENSLNNISNNSPMHVPALRSGNVDENIFSEEKGENSEFISSGKYAKHAGFENMLLLLTPNRSSIRSDEVYSDQRVENTTAASRQNSQGNTTTQSNEVRLINRFNEDPFVSATTQALSYGDIQEKDIPEAIALHFSSPEDNKRRGFLSADSKYLIGDDLKNSIGLTPNEKEGKGCYELFSYSHHNYIFLQSKSSEKKSVIKFSSDLDNEDNESMSIQKEIQQSIFNLMEEEDIDNSKFNQKNRNSSLTQTVLPPFNPDNLTPQFQVGENSTSNIFYQAKNNRMFGSTPNSELNSLKLVSHSSSGNDSQLSELNISSLSSKNSTQGSIFSSFFQNSYSQTQFNSHLGNSTSQENCQYNSNPASLGDSNIQLGQLSHPNNNTIDKVIESHNNPLLEEQKDENTISFEQVSSAFSKQNSQFEFTESPVRSTKTSQNTCVFDQFSREILQEVNILNEQNIKQNEKDSQFEENPTVTQKQPFNQYQSDSLQNQHSSYMFPQSGLAASLNLLNFNHNNHANSHQQENNCPRQGQINTINNNYKYQNTNGNQNIHSNNSVLQPVNVKKQDWICPRCSNLNYSFRRLCNKCQFTKNKYAIHIPPNISSQLQLKQSQSQQS